MNSSSSSRGPANFFTQANALLRKNITFQKRNWKTNTGIIVFPILLCLLLHIIDTVVDNELNKAEFKCGCTCIDTNGDGKCKEVCGIAHSSIEQVYFCPVTRPQRWPALIQVPRPEFRATRNDLLPFTDLPDESCKLSGNCPATVLLTAGNKTFAHSLSANLFPSSISSVNLSDYLSLLADFISGTHAETSSTQFIESALFSRPLYVLLPQCPQNGTIIIPIDIGNTSFSIEIKCVEALSLWRDSSSVVNDELFKGYRHGNIEENINEFVAAYDFLDSNENGFSVNIWYNATYSDYKPSSDIHLLRVPRSINQASNAYIKLLKGAGTMMQFLYVKEMPKPGTHLSIDLSSLIGPIFYTWIIQLLFPVILTNLVYEKEKKLKIMMKMHGLNEAPYWIISYIYFFLLSSVYMFCFVKFGSAIGLKFFSSNSYTVQLVFYSIYINLQISLAFLAASFFSSVKIATVTAYIYVFASGLLGSFFLQRFIEDSLFPKVLIIAMELIPGFSLFRGLYEFGQYPSIENHMGTSGMHWANLNDSQNGMKDVLIIVGIEWLILEPVAFYLDQTSIVGRRGRKDLLFFLPCFRKRSSLSQREHSLQHEGSKVSVEMEKPDVARERELVDHLLRESNISHAIISDNLRKVYPGQDGNPDKLAVWGLSLALNNGECFGMLGPNGAGKTSFINMMIGLVEPTSGTACVRGMDIRTDMNKICTTMGVCPQHDLLWETLTAREHLLFYGRLKNLKCAALKQAVEQSLKSVKLFHGGVADKQVGQYSGGMKRRLSVAISLIGDPKVVYMDEPSTGLDPSSRNDLWKVVKNAKRDRTIILTTHSMEEAEVLCDRVGIFVDGGFQCIGNANELKARYGGSYVFTMTTSPNEEKFVERLVREISRNAVKVYHISGTQKFELPKQGVRIADVFRAVEFAKSKFPIYAWGLSDVTLEDVFIKVAKEAQS